MADTEKPKRLTPAQRKFLWLCVDGTACVTPRFRNTAVVLHERGWLDKPKGRPQLTEAGRAKLAEELRAYERDIDWARLRETKVARLAARRQP